MQNRFAVMWDCDGLEAIVNENDIAEKRMWALLRGKRQPKIPVESNLMYWRLRAQANPQRHYEIYVIDADPDITTNDIRSAFEADPQTMADTIRRIGHRLYSDRQTKERAIV